MNRGVIASPGIIHVRGDGFLMERGLSPQEIRYYALYWDKVIIPTSNIIHVGIPDEEILIESGVIARPRLQFQGRFSGGRVIELTQSRAAALIMEVDRVNDWTMHQFGGTLAIPHEFAESRKMLRFDLVNLLPVPSAEIPIVDILEFKYRRADELNALHGTIENAYMEALNCPDQDLGACIAIRELKKGIENLDAVSTEKWGRTSKFDFGVEVNLDGGKIAQGIAAGAIFDHFSNSLMLPVGQIVGGVASMFKFKASYGTSFKPAAKNSKLAFLSNAHKERIIEK